LFVTILTFCIPNQQENLWEQFPHHLCDNLKHQLQVQHHLDNPSEHEVYNYGLFIIDEILKEHYNTSLCNIPSMPQSIIQWVVHYQNPLIVEQLDWNHEDFISIVNERVPHLNSQ